jgi:hypothetical protein
VDAHHPLQRWPREVNQRGSLAAHRTTFVLARMQQCNVEVK